MSGYMHRDPRTSDLVRLLRCDACGQSELCIGVDSVEVEHPDGCSMHIVDACRTCEQDYALLQAIVADRHPAEPVAPLSRPQEPDQAEQRIEAERARWEAEHKHREGVA